MNCGPEQKLSMEELKRLNPSQCSLPQMRTTLPPTPTQQDWRELLIAMDRLERRLSDQTAVLRELSIRTDACPTQPQIEALSQDVARIRTLLQQDGRKNARRFSALRLELPPIPWRSLILGLAAFPVLGGMLWVAWSSWEKLLEPAPSDFPVKDSTVKPRHTDRKLWQTQRRKKIALGHKPDDQENESVWQHSL